MQSGAPSLETSVPVFVFPCSINFYLEDKSTHKQLLTLYNPYDFAVHFKVLCTAPKKYTVVDPEGSIKPQCCIDIVVRHNAITASNCNVTDKFRIQMREYTTKKVIGKRDVTATLLAGEADRDRSTPEHDSFQQLPTVPAANKPPLSQYTIVQRQGRTNSPNYIVIMAAVVCIVALLLPTEGESESSAIQLSVHLKLIFSYVLGLVTMVILRPY